MINPVRSIDAALGTAADALTPGQRWTAALGLGFATVLLLFGLPPRPIFQPGASGGGAISRPAPTARPRASSAPPAAALSADAGPPSVPGPSQMTDETGAPLPAAPPADFSAARPLAASARVGDLRVVALTKGNPTGLPNRDDATIASTFFTGSALHWTALDAGGAPAAVCAAAAAAGSVAVASQTLPGPLADCLGQRGVTVVAFDEHGTSTRVWSTRRGDVATLTDVAHWGRAVHQLDGRVGVVADGNRRAELSPAVAALGANGLKVVSTTWATDDAAGRAAITGQVEQFIRDGVEEVVMAAPVAVQRDWAQRAQALGAPFHYVVSDVDDGVLDEGYAPGFDGAVAHTSLRVPWFGRDHGSTAVQQRCAARWTATATPSVLLASETPTVYAWCEEVAVVQAVAGGTPWSAVRVASPLTSDLGPLPGGWGPTQDATLVWRAACACWQEAKPFTPR